jgi:uncharacterized protein (TIGR02597 family)
MKKIKTSLLTLGATLIAASSLFAATAYMDPVGAVVVTCLGGPVSGASDTRISIPFMDSPVFVGTVASVAGSDITLTGAAFTAGEFDDVDGPPYAYAEYYVLVDDGSLEGGMLDITTNTADTVTVADSTSGLVAGDTVSICEHWAVTDIGGDLANPVFKDQTKLFLYDSTAPGINKAPYTSYTYWTDEATYGTWYDGSFNVVDAVTLYPGDSFVVRTVGTEAADVELVLSGNVPMNNIRMYVMNDGSDQDNFVGMMSPLGVPTLDTGLGITDQDKIYVPANTAPGINKAPSASYTYWTDYASYWTWYDGVFNDMNAVPLEVGWGYIYRKVGNATPIETVVGTVPYTTN